MKKIEPLIFITLVDPYGNKRELMNGENKIDTIMIKVNEIIDCLNKLGKYLKKKEKK